MALAGDAGRGYMQSRANATICSLMRPPHAVPSRAVPRSIAGIEVTEDHPPHDAAKRREISRSLSAKDPAKNVLAVEGVRGASPQYPGAFTDSKTSPASRSSGAASRAARAVVPAAITTVRACVAFDSARHATMSGSRSSSHGLSERPCPGRSTAMTRTGSACEMARGKLPQASMSAPGSCNRSTRAGPSPQLIPRKTGPQGSATSYATGTREEVLFTPPTRSACTSSPSQSLAMRKATSA